MRTSIGNIGVADLYIMYKDRVLVEWVFRFIVQATL